MLKGTGDPTHLAVFGGKRPRNGQMAGPGMVLVKLTGAPGIELFAVRGGSLYPFAIMPARHGNGRPATPKRKSAPYPFLLEALDPLKPEVRPMFSGFAVYVGEKIVLMLRDSPKHPEDNGVWLVFSEKADLTDPGIRENFPSLRLIRLLGGKIAHWRLIPADSPSFESEALHVCELLLKHDMRLGRIPQSRRTRPSKPRGSRS